MLEKYKSITIDINSTILFALETMNAQNGKLLIVAENDTYKSLISIGDIQRAIIADVDIQSPISQILRQNINVANIDDDIEQVKASMLLTRNEFMPVLSGEELVNIIFWGDLFDDEIRENNTIAEKPPVVIMAGGKGVRLAPITNVLPKPLIPIGDKTVIEDIMDRFVAAGCNDFHISVNYKAEMMKYYFGELNSSAYNISYIQESKPMGTAGSLSLLKDCINSTFFVSNCDIIIEEDYSEIYKYHKENNNEITLVAALKHVKIPYGTIITKKDGLLDSMREKPEYMLKINAGLYILEPHLLHEIPENKFFHITELIERLRSQGRRVGVFPVGESSWIDMGTWEEYMKIIR